MRENNIKIPTINNIDIIKDYFKNAPYIEITDDIKLKKCQLNKLEDKLVNEYGLIKSKIVGKLKFLNDQST